MAKNRNNPNFLRSKATTEQATPSKKISVGLTLSWIFGVLFALTGIISVFSEPLPGLVMLVMAAVLPLRANKLVSAFSYAGLIKQLEYEHFSHSDAVYGVDNCGAGWNKQAAKKAKSYMEYSAFSRGSLIEQLKYKEFTQAHAEYGANAVGI